MFSSRLLLEFMLQKRAMFTTRHSTSMTTVTERMAMQDEPAAQLIDHDLPPGMYPSWLAGWSHYLVDRSFFRRLEMWTQTTFYFGIRIPAPDTLHDLVCRKHQSWPPRNSSIS